MSSIIIHCGAHKTGTSLIQVGLARHSADLLAQGIVYIDYKTAFNKIVQLLHLNKKTNKTQVMEIKNLISGLLEKNPQKNILISHESIFSHANLTNSPPESQFYGDFEDRVKVFLDVIDALDGVDLHLIFYVRRQDTFIESIYLEGFQVGYCLYNFDTFLRSLDLKRISWWHIAQIMRKYIPKERLSFRPFEEIEKGSIQYFKSFLALFCDPNKMSPKPIENARRSLSMPAYNFLKALPKAAPYSEWWRQKLIYLFQRYMSNRHFKKVKFLRQEQRSEILQILSNDNETFFAEYLPKWPKNYYSEI